MRGSTRAILLSGFCAVLVLTALVGVTGLLSLRAAATIAGAMYGERVVPLRDLAQARADLGHIDSQILRAIADGSTTGQADYARAAELSAANIDRLIDEYERTSLVADEHAGLTSYKATWSEYRETFRGVLRAAGAGDSAGATRVYFERAAPQYGAVDDALARLIDVNDREAKLAGDEIVGTYSRALITIGGMLTVALLLGALIAVRQTAQAARANREIQEQADLIAQHARELERQTEDLRAAEARNHALLSAIPDALYRLDRDGLILERRSPHEGQFHLQQEDEGRTLYNVLGPEIGERLRAAVVRTMGTGTPSIVEYERPGPDGPSYHEARLVALGRDQALALIRDIGERKRSERERERLLEQLHQAQKMEALGQMVSGIAHDFNNALTMIVGGVEILQLRKDILKDEAEVRKYLLLMGMAAEDAGSIVGRLRELYRPPGEGEPLRPVDLDRVVHESIALTRPRWQSQAQAASIQIEVRTDLTSTPAILGNPSELREALVNLIFNAVDAMPIGGSITIATRLADDTVQLTVADTGVGMTEDVRQRCLDPFFTMKGEHGTGLGLGMVYGVVGRHQGSLTVESSVGQGTAITLSFPLAAHGEQAVPNGAPAADLPRLQVLVVDDEPKIGDLLRAFLERDGHDVEVAASGALAIERLRSRPYDLLITDRAMPDLSGDQLALAARELRPATRIIMMTGFGSLMRVQDEMPPGVDLLLDKPLQIAQLRRALADVLCA